MPSPSAGAKPSAKFAGTAIGLGEQERSCKTKTRVVWLPFRTNHFGRPLGAAKTAQCNSRGKFLQGEPTPDELPAGVNDFAGDSKCWLARYLVGQTFLSAIESASGGIPATRADSNPFGGTGMSRTHGFPGPRDGVGAFIPLSATREIRRCRLRLQLVAISCRY